MQGIEFVDRLNDVETLELQTKNYVEMLRICCSRVNHHTPRLYIELSKQQDKECIESMRDESYILRLEKENEFLKWYIEELKKNGKQKLPFFGE